MPPHVSECSGTFRCRDSFLPVEVVVDLCEYLLHLVVDVLVLHDLFCGIHEEDVHLGGRSDQMLLCPVAFPDPALEQIALDCALEQFLRNGDHDSVLFLAIVGKIAEPDVRRVAVPSFGKKL